MIRKGYSSNLFAGEFAESSFTRQYSGGQSSEVWLDYEQTTGAGQEECLSQMCRWGLDTDKAGVGYGFRLAGLIIEANRGDAHSKQCLEALALA